LLCRMVNCGAWEFDSALCGEAARHGKLDVLVWARAQNPPCAWNSLVCTWAVRNDDDRMLYWAMDNECPMDRWACAFAASHGKLDVLRALRRAGCAWDENTVLWAQHGRHRKVEDWAVRNGCPTTTAMRDTRAPALWRRPPLYSVSNSPLEE